MKFIRRFSTIPLILFAIIGMLFSIYAIVQVWRLRLPVIVQVNTFLVFSETVVSTAGDGFAIVDTALENADASLGKLEESITVMAKSVEDTSNLATNFASLFSGEFTDTIRNTRISVTAAQSSAKIIDNLLYAFSQIPIIGLPYNPPKPLNIALEEVATNLNGIPESLDKVSNSLESSSSNLNTLETQVSEIASGLEDIQKNLNDARIVLQDTQSDLLEIESSLQNAQRKLNSWVTWTAVILTFLLVSLLVSQFGTLLQGVEIWKENGKNTVKEA
ncbi:MAG: hypothetical protein CVU39_23910 [Chloroflexi bacterium HGW-Chloroflexi-10]|nr:MAG: hypothetical protein CVU39_23910 [Chloroflexi bacterium HGW-Chloroflexi-10]